MMGDEKMKDSLFSITKLGWLMGLITKPKETFLYGSLAFAAL